MCASVFMLTLNPILTPRRPKNLRAHPVQSDITVHSTAAPPQRCLHQSLLSSFFIPSSWIISFRLTSPYPSLLPLCIPFFRSISFGWPPASLSLSPLVAWSCTLAIHLPPLPIQMSQYVPGTMKVQLESHVVVQLRISPLINKMSDWPLLFCSLSFSLPYFIIGMWEYI